MAEVKEVRFVAEVIGIRPPYTWKLFRVLEGSAQRTMVQDKDANNVNWNVAGESDSYQGAVFEAREAAEAAYDRYLQETQTDTHEVFRGPVRVPREDEPPVVER